MIKKQALVLALIGSLVAPMALTTGCAVTQGRSTARAYAKDKEISTRIKTALYADPVAKGTQVNVTSLNGEVQLSGFVDSQAAKDRAGQIARSTPGVRTVHNDLVLPTGRTDNPDLR